MPGAAGPAVTGGVPGLPSVRERPWGGLALRYDIRLVLDYAYGAPTLLGPQIVRVSPRDLGARQKVLDCAVQLAPAPADRREIRDFFGNRVIEAGLDRAAKALRVEMTARVEVAEALAELDISPPLPRLLEELDALRDLGPESPLHMAGASPRVRPDPGVTEHARAAAAGTGTAVAAVEALGLALHRDMTFDAKATDAGTPLAEAFAARRGVCQDFTHIMIAGLRGIGVPAGYVSGFLRTRPPPGRARLVGADAMHAWVRAWCGVEAGWVEYDPTNAVFAGADHVVVAYGRDYADVSPLRGTTRTAGRAKAGHSVDMEVVG